MAEFVAGATVMAILTLGMGAGLVFLMARVNGEVAKVLSEVVRDVFWPKQPPQSQPEPEEENLYTAGMWDDIEEPPWESESMEPLVVPTAAPVS